MTTNLLILGKGDTEYHDRNPGRLLERAKAAGYAAHRADYDGIDRIPEGIFGPGPINVMFFFPYAFWNAHCETPEDGRLYGASAATYRQFQQFFEDASETIARRFGTRALHHVISPRNAYKDRDKLWTVQQLQAHGIPTPEQIASRSLPDIIEAVTPEQGVFIKCRYGAEGKGITVLRHGRWLTTYKVEGGALDGRLADYGVDASWPFTNITGRRGPLEQLLAQDVVVEHEVISPDLYSGKKFDVRAYAVGESVPHLFVRMAEPAAVVTNYSQGGEIRHHPETGLPQEYIDQAKRCALEAARALGSRFLGVDIMFDRGAVNPKVIEVQAFTDFPDVRKFDLARYMVSMESGLFVSGCSDAYYRHFDLPGASAPSSC